MTYADENIGSDCGTFTLLNGEKIESDEALPWREQSAADKSKWTRFACEVKGRDPSDYDNAYPPGPASQTEATSTQGQRRH